MLMSVTRLATKNSRKNTKLIQKKVGTSTSRCVLPSSRPPVLPSLITSVRLDQARRRLKSTANLRPLMPGSGAAMASHLKHSAFFVTSKMKMKEKNQWCFVPNARGGGRTRDAAVRSEKNHHHQEASDVYARCVDRHSTIRNDSVSTVSV